MSGLQGWILVLLLENVTGRFMDLLLNNTACVPGRKGCILRNIQQHTKQHYVQHDGTNINFIHSTDFTIPHCFM